jgi:hypothetical protein
MRVTLSKTTSATVVTGFLAGLVGLPGAALAGLVQVPGPLAGAGLLPVLAVAGGALWLVRKYSSRRQQD